MRSRRNPLPYASVLLVSCFAWAGTPPDPLPLSPVPYRIIYKGKQVVVIPRDGFAEAPAPEPGLGGQTSRPTGFDQVSVAAFDPINNALRINAMLTPGGIHTPTDADQVFTSIFDSTNSAIRVNCVVGCTSTSGTSFTAGGDLAGSNTSQTVVGLQGRPISSTAPSSSNQFLGWNGTQWAPVQPSFLNLFGTVTPAQLPAATSSQQGAILLTHDLGGSASSPTVVGLQGNPVASLAPTTGQVLSWNGSAWAPATAAAGGGTVTSVGLSLPAIFTVSGSPVTSSGTLTGTLVTQNANTVFAGPSSGVAAAPAFRALVAADIPALNYQAPLTTFSAPANQFLTGFTAPGTFTTAQPSFSNLSGTASATQIPNPAGDVTGTYTATTVSGLHFGSTGIPLSTTAPGAGQCLTYNGTAITGASCGSGTAITLQTNGTNNASQTLLNLVAGTNVTLANSGGNVTISAAGGTGAPGGAATQVQFNNSGVFGGSANFTWNNTSNTLTVNGTVAATSFQTTGAGAGQTFWTTGAMSTAAAGQVTCGANTGNIFSCSDSTGPIYPVAFLNDGGDLGGAQGAERVTGLHFGTVGIALSATAPTSGQFLQYNGTNIVGAAALLNPMTTAGDIIVGGTGGSPTRLGLGTSGQCLQSNGTTVVYGACGGTSTATALQFGINPSISLSSTNPTTGQCLTYNGTNIAGGSCGSGGSSLYIWQPFPNASASNLAFRTNGVSVSSIPVVASGTLYFSYVDISVSTADATSTDLYSVGIYGPCAPNSASCAAVVTTKAQALTTAGFVEFGPSQINQTTPITLAPPPSGQYYYIAWTGNAATALVDSPNSRLFSPLCNAYSGNATTGGQVPTSITIPAASWSNGCAMPIFALHN